MTADGNEMKVVNSSQKPCDENAIDTAVTTQAEFEEDVIGVLKDAKAKLTEDEILAVITIRRERMLFTVLEELILDGEVTAVLGGPSDRTPTTADIAFRKLTEEEVAERRKPCPYELSRASGLETIR